mmetsp:Transcript_9237/g.30729  ORF Transcript_9237/g.30729 Transcript_9237/m.30729 type:complete len:389 (-) Transcript_9237:193-1359(-)
MAAVVQHHGAPVLPWVRLLRHPRELDVRGWGVVVLHAHHRVPVVALVNEILQITEEQEIVIREQRPAFVVVQVGHEEPAVRKLGALFRVLFPAVHALRPQISPLQRRDVHRHGRVLLQRKLRNFVRDVLVRVVPEVHAERVVPGRQGRGHRGTAVRRAVLLHPGGGRSTTGSAKRKWHAEGCRANIFCSVRALLIPRPQILPNRLCIRIFPSARPERTRPFLPCMIDWRMTHATCTLPEAFRVRCMEFKKKNNLIGVYLHGCARLTCEATHFFFLTAPPPLRAPPLAPESSPPAEAPRLALPGPAPGPFRKAPWPFRCRRAFGAFAASALRRKWGRRPTRWLRFWPSRLMSLIQRLPRPNPARAPRVPPRRAGFPCRLPFAVILRTKA